MPTTDSIRKPYPGNGTKNLCNQRFGNLHVIGYAGKRRNGRGNNFLALWLCKCDCGEWVFVVGAQMLSGWTDSCGCLKIQRRAERSAKMIAESTAVTRHNAYKIFINAKVRCTVPTSKDYPRYGGRGIEFRFKSFQEFTDALGERPSMQHSVNRIDNDGHYEKGNVEWATPLQQQRNKRSNHLFTARGKTQTLVEWSVDYGIHKSTLRTRIQKQWCEDCILDLIPNRHNKACTHIT